AWPFRCPGAVARANLRNHRGPSVGAASKACRAPSAGGGSLHKKKPGRAGFSEWVLGSFVWPKKPFPVEVDQVRGRIRHPYLGLPCDFPKVTAHDGPVRKAGYIDKAGSRSGKQLGKL